MGKKRFLLDVKLNDTPVYVDVNGKFSVVFDEKTTVTGASVEDLEEKLRKVRGCRSRKILNLNVTIFQDDGWDDSKISEGTLLGYHASTGALRMKNGKKISTVSNGCGIYIVPAGHKNLPQIKKVWHLRNRAWENLRDLNKRISEMLDESGTDAHGSWTIDIDSVLEKEAELAEWITKKMK